MFLFDVLWSFWRSFADLVWYGRKSLGNRLSVYVKSSRGGTVSVDLDPKWDIKEVKEVVGPKIGLPPQDVEIILAGKVLDDSTIVEECDLGEQSILHAVQSHGRGGSKPLNQTLAGLEEECLGTASEFSSISSQDSVITATPPRSQFYVYCNTCQGNRPREGKLRVRCSNCGSGAITLDSDPASWSDVLQPHRISGHCEQQGCLTGPVSWAEFYFKCSEHIPQGDSEEEATSLHLIRPNSRGVPCLACTDVVSPVLVFPCTEGHTTCIPCFLIYCTSRLRERRFALDTTVGYTLPCPAGCPDSMIGNISYFKLLSPQLYTQYQRFATEECVLKNGGVLCPRPGCGSGIFPDQDCNSVKCTCGFVFCKNCLQGNHIGDCESAASAVSSDITSYLIDPSRIAQARWDEASRVMIKAGTKPCPKCRTATERAGGCMHMICTRCEFEWCWVCQVDWSRDCMGSHWFG